MSHERGVTVGGESDEPVRNIYGQGTMWPGQPLPPIFNFEHWQYPSIGQGVQADMQRSYLTNVPGWRMSLSDLLRSNPQIGGSPMPQFPQQRTPSHDPTSLLMLLYQLLSGGGAK